MKDRYLFKAKLINEIWETGLLTRKGNRLFISTQPGAQFMCEAKPETICQCTGLRDKNDSLIWEHDIIEVPGEDGFFALDWDEDTAKFVMNGNGLVVDFDNYWSREVEVVGNKFDNSELLEREE